jgi:hypothetical protein
LFATSRQVRGRSCGALRLNNGGTNVTTKSQSLAGNYSFTATTFTRSPTGKPVMTFAMLHGAC